MKRSVAHRNPYLSPKVPNGRDYQSPNVRDETGILSADTDRSPVGGTSSWSFPLPPANQKPGVWRAIVGAGHRRQIQRCGSTPPKHGSRALVLDPFTGRFKVYFLPLTVYSPIGGKYCRISATATAGEKNGPNTRDRLGKHLLIDATAGPLIIHALT
jgi:hypothetical protein